jgi:DtxR family Mn-dependent transcriptional regulator
MEPNFVRIYKQFPAAAEYLSSIYLITRDYGYVTNVRLAEWMGVSSSAVTQALERLRRLGLVHRKRYENVLLSEAGRTLSLQVLRRHYLLEHLLVRLLDYPWDKADEEAKRLQTQISEDLADHLYSKLGGPQTCPHGNPMPGSRLEHRLLTAPNLSQAPLGEVVRILRVTEEGEQVPTMLAFCFKHGLRPGASFQILAKGKRTLHLQRSRVSGDSKAKASVSLPLDLAEHIRYEVA